MAVGHWLIEDTCIAYSHQPTAIRDLPAMNAPHSPNRRFTVEEANCTLPLVRAIVSDIVTLANDLAARNDRLSITQVTDAEDGDLFREEVFQMQDELEAAMDRLQGFVDELSELGVELKSATAGLVNFRTQIEGNDAYLSWKLGEDEIGHWHKIDADDDTRESLFEGIATDNGPPRP